MSGKRKRTVLCDYKMHVSCNVEMKWGKFYSQISFFVIYYRIVYFIPKLLLIKIGRDLHTAKLSLNFIMVHSQSHSIYIFTNCKDIIMTLSSDNRSFIILYNNRPITVYKLQIFILHLIRFRHLPTLSFVLYFCVIF